MRTKTKNPRWLSGRNDVRVLTLSLVLSAGMLFVSFAVGQAQSVLPEVQVTTAAIPDFEFDSARDGAYCPACNGGDGNSRIVFSDNSNNLWVGRVDFQTGAFLPADGHGALVATNATAATDYGNGPEWMFSNGDSRFVYTQCQAPCDPPNGATASLGLATQVAGTWTTTTLANSITRASPAATLDLGDPDPRINYVNTDKTAWFMRKSSALAVETVLPLSEYSNGNARRWVPGTRKIVFPGAGPSQPTNLREQIWLYDTDTGETPEQLTNHPIGVEGAMMWRAPEFKNAYVFFTMAKGRKEILVYRQLPGADGVMRWTIVKTISAPAALPFFFSPEVFTHNGRSYIFAEVSSTAAFFDRSVPNQLAISGVDPLRQDARLLTNDTGTPRLRLDPEYFITAQGPFIYYNRLIPETANNPPINDGVWRVDTGLGPAQ
jgi:hypothetical protein